MADLMTALQARPDPSEKTTGKPASSAGKKEEFASAESGFSGLVGKKVESGGKPESGSGKPVQVVEDDPSLDPLKVDAPAVLVSPAPGILQKEDGLDDLIDAALLSGDMAGEQDEVADEGGQEIPAGQVRGEVLAVIFSIGQEISAVGDPSNSQKGAERSGAAAPSVAGVPVLDVASAATRQVMAPAEATGALESRQVTAVESQLPVKKTDELGPIGVSTHPQVSAAGQSTMMGVDRKHDPVRDLITAGQEKKVANGEMPEAEFRVVSDVKDTVRDMPSSPDLTKNSDFENFLTQQQVKSDPVAKPLIPADQMQRLSSPMARNVAEQVSKIPLEDGQTTIRLKPHGLGMIEVEISKDLSGRHEISIRVQNPMVLDALRADRATLGDIVTSQAGSGSLNLDLFQSGSQNGAGREEKAGNPILGEEAQEDDTEAEEVAVSVEVSSATGGRALLI